jgi:hypothetical protein
MVTWLRELASAASVENGADQDAEVAFVDAGDGVAEADVRLVGKSPRSSQVPWAMISPVAASSA